MSALSRYWIAPMPAVRPWLFFKTALLLFGLDVFYDHLAPAWRYGAAGFNVAHFAILDALPIPSSAFYVGIMIATALVAFVCALSPRPHRALIGFVAIAYLWSWSCSMHDSYQHHYLLSLFFLAFAFFPLLSSRDLFWSRDEASSAAPSPAPKKDRKGGKDAPRATTQPTIEASLPHGLVPRASAWAMVVVWTTASIVYAYTAVSKTENEWIRGDALRNITSNGRAIPGAVRLFESFGIEGDDLWPFLGASTVVLQIGLAIGYALAPIRDRIDGPRIALEIVSYVALALALSFHLGAEYMGLEIGWFSWYMILLALATFLPARALGYLVLFSTMPIESLRRALETHRDNGIAGAVLAMLAAGALLGAGTYADLPGATVSCTIVGLATMAAAVVAMLRRRWFDEVRAAAIALLFGAAALVLMLPAPETDVRYDYWRFAGGDFRRRGEWALALEAYQHANRYAPEGQSRDAQIEQMRARIEAEGPRRESP